MRVRSAVLDGEICCLAPNGGTRFDDLLFRRERPFFYAFDALAIDGEDLRGLGFLPASASGGVLPAASS